jgi:DNA-binding NtrC family response regulator
MATPIAVSDLAIMGMTPSGRGVSPPASNNLAEMEMRQDSPISVLLVEGHTDLRRVMRACLEQLNIRVMEAANAHMAKEMLRAETPGALIVDYDFPYLLNGEVIEACRQHAKGHPAIIVTTTQRISDGWREKYRPSAVVYKPFDVRLLLKTVLSCVQERRRSRQVLSA